MKIYFNKLASEIMDFRVIVNACQMEPIFPFISCAKPIWQWCSRNTL